MAQSRTKVQGPANVHTAKEYQHVATKLAGRTHEQRTTKSGNEGGTNAGEIPGMSTKFSKPMNSGVNAAIGGIGGLHDDIGEKSGFATDGYLDKGDTQFGENVKLNFLPPGMDISNQELAEINEMPLRKLTAESFPGDGWMPAPRDLPE